MIIASAIAMDITLADMKPGERLGIEASLASYYGVARATLRGSIKILSLHGRVKVQRGIRGGLAVDSLSPEFTFGLTNECMSQMNIDRSCATEVLDAFEDTSSDKNLIRNLFLDMIKSYLRFTS